MGTCKHEKKGGTEGVEQGMHHRRYVGVSELAGADPKKLGGTEMRKSSGWAQRDEEQNADALGFYAARAVPTNPSLPRCQDCTFEIGEYGYYSAAEWLTYLDEYSVWFESLSFGECVCCLHVALGRLLHH